MTHQNNFLSVCFGSILSIGSYITNNPYIDNVAQLLKVILFGIIGGVFGYFGKIIGEKIHRLFKN